MMKLPNWQHHSKKEVKRTLKPQALRQAKKRRAALKAKLLAASVVLVGFASPAVAHPRHKHHHDHVEKRYYTCHSHPRKHITWHCHDHDRWRHGKKGRDYYYPRPIFEFHVH
ncbi:gp5 [Synechococcus phage syn9]|uniref:Gp5 n=1 Tax=Synechococcus phage syn9 TaxID=382359 RepID=Q0QZL8_BPSYS|nr:gp5 [Synechococcus phage syn9]ABA46979.1 gp5 [Synechococcus phage syn9]